jgi:phosphoribosyl-ATP pyrophosphohydrolase
VKFNQDGLCPTIIQDQQGQVLMLAYSSAQSLKQALKQGKGIYYSRSRQEIWEKGLTSGNWQRLISCRLDCDFDSILFTVEPNHAACHTQNYSCFGGQRSAKFSLNKLFEILKERKVEQPKGSYSVTLLNDREKLMQKILEEAGEVINFTCNENLRWEIADLLYFLSVLAVAENIEWKDIEAELAGRRH